MKMRVEVIFVNPDGSEQRSEVLAIERHELVMETLGISLAESKTLLSHVQNCMVARQVDEDLERRRLCSGCGQRHKVKDAGTASVKTLFGEVGVPNPQYAASS